MEADVIRQMALSLPEATEQERPPDFATGGYLLVDVDRLGPDVVRAVLVQAWRLVAPKRAIAQYESEG